MLKRFTTHTLMALAEASLVALLVVGLIAGTAFAGKGGKGGGKPTSGGGTVELVVLSGGDATPNWGESVTFTVSTTASTRPFVGLSCYQGGVWVYSGSVGYFPEYPWDQYFILRNGTWSSGAADCTAKLYYVNSRGNSVTLATMSFAVAP